MLSWVSSGDLEGMYWLCSGFMLVFIGLSNGAGNHLAVVLMSRASLLESSD